MTEKEKSMKEQLDEDKAQEAVEQEAENAAKEAKKKQKVLLISEGGTCREP